MTPARVVVCFVKDEAWPADHTRSYSGGRYHALSLSYAFAAAGAQVTVVINGPVAFAQDFERLSGASVRFVISPHMDPRDVDLVPDYVVVGPASASAPGLYAFVDSLVAQTGAIPLLINYESPNWFNLLAPTPDDPHVWDPWRRVVARGGIVLSSTYVGDRYARDFYRANGNKLVFEQCYPPINSATADAIGAQVKDGSIVLFARPFHDYKGGEEVFRLPSAIFEGRTLHAIFGGEPNHDYVQALREHLSRVPDTHVEVHSRIEDWQKYVLLFRAQALLFPSLFEGFGYPAVEAIYAGTEVVCYDLPVLSETVGSVAHMAKVGDTAGLGKALQRALDMPERADLLRRTVSQRMSLPAVSQHLREMLGRLQQDFPSRSPVRPPSGVLWGPWPDDPSDYNETDYLSFPPFPPQAACRQKEDSVEVTLVVWTSEPIIEATLAFNELVVAGVCIPIEGATGWVCNEVRFLLGEKMLGRKLTLSMRTGWRRSLTRTERLVVRRAN